MTSQTNQPEPSGDPKGIPETFREVVRQAVAAVGWKLRREDADGLECVDANGVPHSLGLEGFYRRFKDKDPAEWPALVAGHFRTVIALTKGDSSDDLNAQAEHILVRLGKPYPAAPPVSVWSRPVEGTELAVMLVIEQGQGLRYVRTDMVEASGRAGDGWIAIGLENLRRRTPPDALHVMEPESGLMACCVGDNHDATRALLLDSLLPEPAPHGVLLSVPRRDALLVLPFDHRALQQRSLALLKVFTQNQHDEASHPISTEVFWVKGGRWHSFGIEVSEAGVKVRPSPEAYKELQAIQAEGTS